MNMPDSWRFFTKRVAAVIAATVAITLLWIPLNARASALTAIHSFTGGADGAAPFASLTLSGSTLYGTTEGGGAGDVGTIFKVKTDSTGYQVLHTFNLMNDGALPWASLTLSGSTLYGTASEGGSAKFAGTIFKVKTDGTGYQVLHTFTGVDDGAAPWASLTLSGSTLYGTTTQGGGVANDGTIFKINTDSTGYKVLHSFTGSADGAVPYASLTLSGSTLYGTAYGGGPAGYGTIFKINADGSGFKVLHNFTGGAGGAAPYASLTLLGSTLYGTTVADGADGYGTIFKVNTDGTGYKVLHSFAGGDYGGLSSASLTLSGSTLYGTTQAGGVDNDGTIFKINADGTGYKVLYSFTAADDGSTPCSSLTLSGSTLYGTAEEGGADNEGTIFSLYDSSIGGLWQGSQDLGNGWRYLSWFGAFNPNSSPWIYHQTLGWLYPFGTSTDSIWFYDPQWDGSGGWWWTSSSVFPWIYSSTEGEWLYYDASATGARWFFTSGGQASTH